MMIQTFRCRETEKLHATGVSKRFRSIARVALRKLDILHAAARLDDLKVPPGNRLERLFGNRDGQYSIRINDRWRICFRWVGRDAEDVEIVDYH